jgi:hypothetical protein
LTSNFYGDKNLVCAKSPSIRPASILGEVESMRKESAFSKAKRNSYAGFLKRQVTIRLDEENFPGNGSRLVRVPPRLPVELMWTLSEASDVAPLYRKFLFFKMSDNRKKYFFYVTLWRVSSSRFYITFSINLGPSNCFEFLP